MSSITCRWTFLTLLIIIFLSLGMSSLLLLLNPTAIVITSSEQNLWWSLTHLLGAASDSDSFKPDLG